MNHKDKPRPQLVRRADGLVKPQTARPRQQTNHPVTVDEFERERMGIAAKE